MDTNTDLAGLPVSTDHIDLDGFPFDLDNYDDLGNLPLEGLPTDEPSTLAGLIPQTDAEVGGTPEWCPTGKLDGTDKPLGPVVVN